MEAVLRERGLLTPGVAAELAAGRRYWREERRLCSLMQQHPVVPPGGHGADCGFTLAEALMASGAKVGSMGAWVLHHAFHLDCTALPHLSPACQPAHAVRTHSPSLLPVV